MEADYLLGVSDVSRLGSRVRSSLAGCYRSPNESLGTRKPRTICGRSAPQGLGDGPVRPVVHRETCEARPAEIHRMESAFAHTDLRKALAL